MTEDAISIGGVDLADANTYVAGMPHEAFRELRERAPVAWHPYKDGPGFLALTGYDEVLVVSRDSVTWSSETDGVSLDVHGPDNPAPDSRGILMLTMDPPRHTALRKLVNRGFTPRQVANLNSHIADMARDVVDGVIEKGECDFVKDVAGALPSYVAAQEKKNDDGAHHGASDKRSPGPSRIIAKALSEFTSQPQLLADVLRTHLGPDGVKTLLAVLADQPAAV